MHMMMIGIFSRTVVNVSVKLLALLPLLVLAPFASAAAPSLDQVRAHGFEVVTADGKRVPLADLVPAGRPAVVEFWATWCAPCRKTIPHLVELSKRYPGTKLTVLGLTIEDFTEDQAKVAKFVAEQGVTYPVAFATPELFRFMNQRAKVGVPKVLIYDANGNVVEHIVGYNPLTNRRIESAVSRALRTN